MKETAKDRIASVLFILVALCFTVVYYGSAYLGYRKICSKYPKTVHIP